MLYRRYRPQSFSEVVGQDHVVRTLRGALSSGRVGHAYLFAGPRGTGKTTLARIMAKAVNCTNRGKTQDPCNRCESCAAMNEGRSMDLVEIDAASNRGIDDVRALKESAGTAAAGGAHKVFIVDEVHMLTKDAFNALLKVLEEPPAHVMFLLATTEAHKILPTVLSRVQRFDVRRLTPEQIAEKLGTIAKAEKVSVAPEALLTIAKSADGALRDAEVMLSRVLTEGGRAVDTNAVVALLGLVPATWHQELASRLFAGDRAGALTHLTKVHDSGADADHYCKGVLEHLRELLMAKVNDAPETKSLDGKFLVRTIQAFIRARQELRTSPLPYLPLELAVVDLTEPIEGV
ncbi:MAG TPA: DNA polymerase III subunit gamma/tau [Candidatus Paceibacterota bacterium]|nr:DNA polymerase III subunit gamma/tau [Candidatus Paceibacterota bacterium]